MKKQHLAIPLGAILISSLIFFSCKKINESTTLGGDLIPPVDNIHTFDTVLDVQVFNDTFSVATDSTIMTSSYVHYLGMISNDPFFGRTDARMYLQLKPSFFPYSFSGRPDSLHIDSVVLVLDYRETYGDSLFPQTVNVYEIAQSSDFSADTIYKYEGYQVRKQNIQYAGLLGSRTFQPRELDDSVFAFRDTTANQLRIRLDDAFGARLLAFDSTTGHAFKNDSTFNTKFRGFALESVNGDALMGFNLSASNTKLAIYYRDDNGDAPVANWDTLVAYWSFTTLSASAQYVKRDYTGTPVEMAAGDPTPASTAYIQTTPGTFATVRIPGLSGLNNRIVHRAELIMEQIYDITDSTYLPPTTMYLDAYDPSASTFRTVPFDFQFDYNGNANLSAFGAYPYFDKDPFGNPIRVWRFNLSRYVQNLVNGTEVPYDFRLYAPLYTRELYRVGGPSNNSNYAFVPVSGAVARGRVRLHGGGDGSQPTPNPQRMRLRIVYSKL